MFGNEKAPRIAQHHQDVLIYGVDMKQIVLHLTHDPPENRQVAAEDAVLIHAPELVGDSTRLPQDGHETRPVDGVAAKRRVDAVAIPPKRPEQMRGHAFELGMLLHHEKALQDRRRAPREKLVISKIQQFVDGLSRIRASQYRLRVA